MIKSGINHSWTKFAVAFNLAMLMSMLVSAQLTVSHLEDIPIACFGGTTTISVSVTGGTQTGLEYSLDGIDWQLSNIFADLAAGAQTVYARDDGANTGNESFVISQPAELTYTLPDPLYFCALNDGRITVNPAGGTPDYTIEVVGSVSGSLGQNIVSSGSAVYSSLGEETFTITVSDANGCVATPQNVALFRDVTNPTFNTLPLDYETSAAVFNAANDPNPVQIINDNTVRPVSGTFIQYDTELNLQNYSNARATITVTQNAAAVWDDTDSVRIYVSYDGVAFTEIYSDPSVWNPATALTSEGNNQKGDGNPLTSASIALGAGADFNPSVALRVRVRAGDAAATATVTNLRVVANERFHTISPLLSGQAPDCDDGTGSGCNGLATFEDSDPVWICQDAGNEEFSFIRTWSAVDMCNNEVTYNQTIRVGSIPTFTVLRDSTLDYCNHADVSLIGPSYTDNCPASTITVEWEVTGNGDNVVPNAGSGSNPSITFPQPHSNDTTYTITWTLTDDAGFVNTAEQQVRFKSHVRMTCVPVGDPDFCSGESQAFTVTITGGTGNYDDPVFDPAGSWSWINASSGTYTTSGLTLDPSVETISITVTDNDVFGPPAIEGNCSNASPFEFSNGNHFTLHDLIATPAISRD